MLYLAAFLINRGTTEWLQTDRDCSSWHCAGWSRSATALILKSWRFKASCAAAAGGRRSLLLLPVEEENRSSALLRGAAEQSECASIGPTGEPQRQGRRHRRRRAVGSPNLAPPNAGAAPPGCDNTGQRAEKRSGNVSQVQTIASRIST